MYLTLAMALSCSWLLFPSGMPQYPPSVSIFHHPTRSEDRSHAS